MQHKLYTVSRALTFTFHNSHFTICRGIDLSKSLTAQYNAFMMTLTYRKKIGLQKNNIGPLEIDHDQLHIDLDLVHFDLDLLNIDPDLLNIDFDLNTTLTLTYIPRWPWPTKHWPWPTYHVGLDLLKRLPWPTYHVGLDLLNIDLDLLNIDLDLLNIDLDLHTTLALTPSWSSRCCTRWGTLSGWPKPRLNRSPHSAGS